MDFSPQKMAALNARYVSVSMKCSEVEDVIARKKDEHTRLDNKIKALELGKLTLENDKRRIMCQIKDQKLKWSSSPIKQNPLVKEEDDLFGDDDDLFGDDDVTDSVLLGIKEGAEEISSGQGVKEIGPIENVEGEGRKAIGLGENVTGDDEPAPKKQKADDV